MLAFVTVGTFAFDALIDGILSHVVLDALYARGYDALSVQCGHSKYVEELLRTTPSAYTRRNVSISLFASKSSLSEDFSTADLVIGHAGAGTILEVLRLNKPLIVVPNPSLLHNHQMELAAAMAGPGYLILAGIDNLGEQITNLDLRRLQEFPAFDGSRFRAVLDQEMGF